MAEEDKRLFPELPEDLKALSDDERGKLLADHEAAKELILEDNAEFLGDLTANEIIAQLKQGVAQIKQIKEVSEELKAEFENYQAKKQELVAELEPMKAEDEDPGDEDDSKDSDDSEDEDSSKAEGDPEAEGEKVEVEVEAEEKVLVTASAAELRSSRSLQPAAPEGIPRADADRDRGGEGNLPGRGRRVPGDLLRPARRPLAGRASARSLRRARPCREERAEDLQGRPSREGRIRRPHGEDGSGDVRVPG